MWFAFGPGQLPLVSVLPIFFQAWLASSAKEAASAQTFLCLYFSFLGRTIFSHFSFSQVRATHLILLRR